MTKEQQLEKMKELISVLDQLWEAGCEMDDSITELMELAQMETEEKD